VRRYAFLAVEDLEIRNMLRRANPVADPANPGQFLPNGAAAKRGLNRSIADASWGQFVSILRAKGEDAGRVLVDVDPPHTSTKSRPQLTHTALMPSSRAPKTCYVQGCHSSRTSYTTAARTPYAGRALLTVDAAATGPSSSWSATRCRV